ncbi:toxic anion resistance protein [Undibacterium sp. RTI2.1]|uniref:toxic anion resistance protein n=1 Tax=unclassified Undibacterium TaxID=2630295 RepID=UPI002AB4CDF7|nr:MULTISPECIES: toxic anion resistance protein [unclassified Undibacterium]MDY7540152.1 toxic anion resistance protein [Undibacterium sp. 5I1]MEB0030326.1 toxic anion resistance protein [Undibacterium sp. RTI2.1]MEB0115394.1 toxic anion resistance protein [Undibacterium sp. RTI2.2]MEB0230601.1 toxic anion resistance protein [Undibacterium sp. 10I3]MEB0257079.1 toxic anion resistance protein [Undibacterium sp. 5I1]
MSEQKTETSELTLSTSAMAPLYSDNLPVPVLKYELQAERQIDLNKFSDEQKNRINQIASSVSFSDTNSLMSFGSDVQRELSQHLDQLLEGMRTSEAGRAGEITIALATTLRDLNLPKVKQEVEGHHSLTDALGKIPFVGDWFSALRALQQNHKKITDHLTAIEKKSQAQLTTLRSTNDKLDRMVQGTIDHIKNMELYMAAGQILVKRARVEFEQKRAAVEQSRDLIEIARLRDFGEQINAFETRIVRIHMAHSQSIISVPEIRATQTASMIEMNNVMDSILFDLPSLKRAIINVAALSEVAKASKATDARRALSRELNSIGSDELQVSYLKAKDSQGDFAADVAALAMSADKLLQTIELGRKLDIANVGKREKAITELSAINRTFTDGLIQSGDQFVQKIAS